MKFLKQVAADYWVFIALLTGYLIENKFFFNKKDFKKQIWLSMPQINTYLARHVDNGNIEIKGRKIIVNKDILKIKWGIVLER